MRKNSLKSVEIRPKRVQAWLESLPLTDSTGTAQQLFQALRAQNRILLGAQNRLTLMELYRRPVIYLSEALQTGLVNAPLPLSSKHRRFFDLVSKLEWQMAAGYKLVIDDTLAPKHPGGKVRFLPLAILRAIDHLGRVLLGLYHVYMSCPDGIWRKIHQLYQRAEQNGFEDQIVEGAEAPPATAITTVSKAYQQVLLLGICNPYGLHQGECKRVHTFLNRWPLQVTIGHDLNVPEPEGRFLISLTADAPPIPFPRRSKFSTGNTLRVLDVIEAVRDVHALLGRLENGETPTRLGLCEEAYMDTEYPDLLRRVGRLWGLPSRRQSQRSPKKDAVTVCVGINATHFFIRGRRPFLPPNAPGTASVLAATPAESAPQAPSVAVDLEKGAHAQTGAEARDTQRAAMQAAPAASSGDLFDTAIWPSQEEYPVYQWQTRDESAGGLALERNGNLAVRMRVGDLLAIRYQGLDTWRVGVVRWLKSHADHYLEMGIQRLAPDVRPAAVQQMASSPDQRPNYLQALLLPANKTLRRPDTLIIPRGALQSGQKLRFADENGAPRVVRPLQLLDRTGTFDQIVFAPA